MTDDSTPTQPQPTEPQPTESAADVVNQIIEKRGLTRADIATELRRSPRMVSKILNGETSGQSYLPYLTELRDNGTIDRRPPRRRDKSGNIVPVRAKIDHDNPPEPPKPGEKTKAPTVVPEDTDGRYTTKVPNRFSEKSSYSKDGNRVHQVTMSKTNKDSRARGMKTIMGKLATVARSQAHKDKKVTFTVTLDNGREIKIGEKNGTYVSQAMRSIKAEGGFAQWVDVVMAAMYEGKNNSPGNHQVVGCRMNVTDYKTPDKLAVHSKKKH